MEEGKVNSEDILSILVVDDEPNIVFLVSRYFRRLGHRIIGADGPEAARQIAESDPSIAVLLSDVRMPGEDGLTLAAHVLRARPEAHALEIILLTGGATTDVAINALRVGTFDLVQKPPRMEELAAVVDRAMVSARRRRARAEQEMRVRERMDAADDERTKLTARLTESMGRLSEVEAALAASRQVRKDLLAVISHEIRTPLIPLIGFSEIIASGTVTDPDSLREYGKLMQDGGRNLLRLIETALDYVALGQGEALERQSPQFAGLVLHPIARRLAAEAEAKNISIRTDIPDGLTLAGDLPRIASAVGHLIDNAIKASPEGETIVVACRKLLAGGVSIDVTDQGPGIPADIVALVGTPFLQADMSLKRTWSGAGLGLALARRVAEAHGGRLVLEAGVHGGTVAQLELGYCE